MACCEGYAFVDGGERVFDVDTSRISYGSGAMLELGGNARLLGMHRVALFTDTRVAAIPLFSDALRSLHAAGCEVVIYDRVRVEPTNESFADAIAFACDVRADGYVSIGGGSSIDTCKAANLYATHPAEFLAYVNAPVGEGRPVPGPLAPHIAAPTTAGTGSECTGVAIFDHLPIEAKTGIASRRLRPTLALIDPDWTATLPAMVVASAGFDVLAHALESYTALPYTQRAAAGAGSRPLSQGANPFSDVACLEALRILGRNLVRAVTDPSDAAARERMMFAATLAGIGFGNSGVHVPHAMAYAVAGLVREYHAPDYPGTEPIVPHGMSVILNAPAAFRFTAAANPERHRTAAAELGADVGDVADAEAGEALAARIRALMGATGMPADLRAVGYGAGSVGPLVAGTLQQTRLLKNAPLRVDAAVLEQLFTGALDATRAGSARAEQPAVR
ncbi:MAG: hydroxyacid-oxoacid transhydrogenase [Candidatus Velthaea sp.]